MRPSDVENCSFAHFQASSSEGRKVIVNEMDELCSGDPTRSTENHWCRTSALLSGLTTITEGGSCTGFRLRLAHLSWASKLCQRATFQVLSVAIGLSMSTVNRTCLELDRCSYMHSINKERVSSCNTKVNGKAKLEMSSRKFIFLTSGWSCYIAVPEDYNEAFW
jgi:hypothetical protein